MVCCVNEDNDNRAFFSVRVFLSTSKHKQQINKQIRQLLDKYAHTNRAINEVMKIPETANITINARWQNTYLPKV